MPRIKINLGDVESGFGVYPEGWYEVEIQESSKLKTTSDGNPYIMWIAKIVDGEYEGKMISWNTSLQPQALFNLKTMIEACTDAKGRTFDWDPDGFDTEALAEYRLMVHNVPKVVDDVERNQIKGYAKVGGQASDKNDGSLPF
jgi:hypothetical protein